MLPASLIHNKFYRKFCYKKKTKKIYIEKCINPFKKLIKTDKYLKNQIKEKNEEKMYEN